MLPSSQGFYIYIICISHTPTQVISVRVTLPGSWTAAISSLQSLSVLKNPKSDSFSHSQNINRPISDLRGKKSEKIGSLELSPDSFTSRFLHWQWRNLTDPFLTITIAEKRVMEVKKLEIKSELIHKKSVVWLGLALDSCKKNIKCVRRWKYVCQTL